MSAQFTVFRCQGAKGNAKSTMAFRLRVIRESRLSRASNGVYGIPTGSVKRIVKKKRVNYSLSWACAGVLGENQ